MNRRSVQPHAEKVIQLRTEKGWSLEYLASRAKLSAGTVWRIEHGLRVYRDTLKKVTDALGVEVRDLLIEDSPPVHSPLSHLTEVPREALIHALRLAATQGPATPECEIAFTRVYLVCEETRQLPQLYTALQGICFSSLATGDTPLAITLGTRLFKLAEENLKAPAFRMEARVTLAAVLSFSWNLSLSRELLQAAYDLYMPEMNRSPYTLADSKVTCLIYMAHVWYSLGYPKQAQAFIQEAFDWSSKVLSHGYSIVLTRHFGAALYQLLRDFENTAAWAESEAQQSEQFDLALWKAGGAIQQGWAWAMQGREQGDTEKIADGLRRMNEGMQRWHLTKTRLALARWHTLLAEAYGAANQPETGLAELEKALLLGKQTGDRHYEAEAHRLKGVLLLQRPVPDETMAEECFQNSLSVARQQQAKSFELRATMDLSRLWQRQGKRNEAYQALTEVYGWFSEGFDTPTYKKQKDCWKRWHSSGIIDFE